MSDWLDHYEASPWGPTRDDLRMEAFRQRLLASLLGSESEGDIPGAVWPYKSVNDARDWGAVIAAQEELMELLEEDGDTGRIKWKDGKAPSALTWPAKQQSRSSTSSSAWEPPG